MLTKHFFNKSRYYSIMGEFIQKINPLSAKSEWVVQAENYDFHQEVARAAYADMLHDYERNQMYEAGLKVAIEHMHKMGKKAHVLDIGTGTGLLSMMAVRNGADSVHACEAFKPMGECALNVIKLNNCSSKIKVIPKRSTDLKVGEDMPCKANILVTEVFDTELIGEGALGTFKHAHQELLEEDCIVIPHSATVYAQIVESSLLTGWNRLKNVYDDDGNLLINVCKSIKECRGSSTVHDMQLSQLTPEQFKPLTTPQTVLRFDFSGKTPILMERSTISTIKSTADGMAVGVFMWWDINMDIHNQIVLSCAPAWIHPAKNNAPWRDHWMQAVYYFPREIQTREGEEMHLISCHDEFSLWFNVKHDLKLEQLDYEYPSCDCNLHLAFSRTRIGQLNDNLRTKKYLRIIEDSITEESVVLVLSHGFYQSLAAAKKAKQLYVLEPLSVSRRFIKELIAENNLQNVTILDSCDDFTPDGSKINVVLSEPYFVTSILPWDNLHILYLLNQFREHLADDVQIFPQQAIIKAVAVKFDHLHKIRSPLGECEGFAMKPFDELIETSSEKSDDHIEAQPLWEYPGIALSDANEIAKINLNDKAGGEVSCQHQGTLVINGESCNGIAVWVDWILDVNSAKSVISTGPVAPIEVGQYISWDKYTRQGVILLGDKTVPTEMKYGFSFNSVNPSFNLKFSL